MLKVLRIGRAHRETVRTATKGLGMDGDAGGEANEEEERKAARVDAIATDVQPSLFLVHRNSRPYGSW